MAYEEFLEDGRATVRRKGYKNILTRSITTTHGTHIKTVVAKHLDHWPSAVSCASPIEGPKCSGAKGASG
jgi:hypothetical protein